MGHRVLICDDAGFVREILSKALLELGYEVVGEARDGQEAIEMALNTRPDIILMDFVLPVKSGAEASVEIRSHLPQVRIVAMSTVDEEFLRFKATEAGCDSWMAKPFSKALLKDTLAQFFNSSREVQNG